MGGHLYSPDEELMFRTTASLAERASLAIEPLLGFGTKTGKDGREYAQYGVGQSLAALPLYYLGKIFSTISSGEYFCILFFDTVQYHSQKGVDYLLRFFVSLFNPLITALTALLITIFGWRLTNDKKAAILTAVIYGCGTMALPHSKTFFSEPLAGLMVLTALFFLFRATQESQIKYTFIAGTAYGYALLTRMDSLLFLPGLIFFLLLENQRRFATGQHLWSVVLTQFRKQALIYWLSFLLPIFIFLFVILFLNYLRFGNLLSTGYEDQPEGVAFSTPILVGLYGFLFSIGKGIFFFSPPLVLFLFALKRLWREWRNLAIAILILVGVFLLVQSTWRNWAGGWCWGPRHIFQLHSLLALPIVLLLKPPRSSSLRISVICLLIIGFAIQLYGASQSFIDFYIDFYRTPAQPPNAYVLYAPEEVELLNQYYRLEAILPGENRAAVPIDLRLLIAPMNDSIYVVQNSQWYGYLKMWEAGRTDFFWLRVFGSQQREKQEEFQEKLLRSKADIN